MFTDDFLLLLLGVTVVPLVELLRVGVLYVPRLVVLTLPLEFDRTLLLFLTVPCERVVLFERWFP